MEVMTLMFLLAWERGRLCGNVAIPADSGPSHLLLLRHLLHGSLKRFRKHLPDVLWVRGIPPQWRERMLNGLWIFCLYFPPEASQQAGDVGPLTGVLFCGACSWVWLDVGSFQSCIAMFLLETCSFKPYLHQYSRALLLSISCLLSQEFSPGMQRFLLGAWSPAGSAVSGFCSSSKLPPGAGVGGWVEHKPQRNNLWVNPNTELKWWWL